ncbi:MAG: hypothetical protein P1U90_15010 [Akkermansiaceae bacterium]|jgi:hypothetical protein|nr:hypothetical protein [Akkermansiaceae bacterium]
MKKLIPLLFLGLIATLLPSCCGFGGCKQLGRIDRSGCENQAYTTQKVTKYKTVKRMVDPGTKGGIPYEAEEKVAYTETVKVKAKCGACGSTYCPAPGCCGTVSPAVLKRATAQNGTGEPHIGTIPTMKVLAE